MKTTMIRYTTSAAQADANEALVRAVFEELRSVTPEGLRYSRYRLADGVTFVHIVTYASAGADKLTTLAAFKTFQKELKARCVESPLFTELLAIDSYGLVA